ncbi:uncharacterized protein H6S33_001475 [Morchella sextelata]|uniref:uncharacterized protein n=1 Tax=Morchella sextelata TaxID=1174677 RepID=UPI001D04F037|nr:uncharacterized protein H6S33_001475 [Morchella sextelata]KAH0608341.1 hypothetical protein H6S33_001475 [Morchella sextelata]
MASGMTVKRYLLLAFVVVVSTYLLLSFMQTPPYHGPSISLPARELDHAYIPRRKLDIVIASYREDLHELSTHLTAISLLPNIASLDANIIVYTKDANASADSILDHLGADRIVHLPNRGREGGTYLTHIIENWDDLAEHTLFIQAEIHNFGHFQRRLLEYFVPETGMLSLGFGGITCNLTDCTDPWNWHDDAGHLPRIYEEIYDRPAPAEALLLSYKGQFIVSGKRIRSLDRYYYEYLREILESSKSAYSGKESGTSAGNAPRFGYTLERAWGLIFGCADGRIAAECPGYWHRKAGGEDVGSCQCLDS